MGKHGRKLTAAFVRSVREPGLHWDEHGLVLRVKPSGYKQWIQRLFIHGKRRELGARSAPPRDPGRSGAKPMGLTR